MHAWVGLVITPSLVPAAPWAGRQRPARPARRPTPKVRVPATWLRWIVWVVATAAVAGCWSGPARAAASPAAPGEQEPLRWQLERRALTLAVSTLPGNTTGAGDPSSGNPPAATSSPRYWLGTALEGRMRPPAGGSRVMRGVLAFSATGSPSQVGGLSLGAATLQRRLVQAGALVTSSAELWVQWDNRRDGPEGLVRLEGSAAAGRLGGAAVAWYASDDFDPWPTWAGEVAAGDSFFERLQARASAGASAVVRQALGQGRYWETRLAWQESTAPGLHLDAPRLGYSLRFVMGRQGSAASARTTFGARFRPSVFPGVIPQAGLGFTLRRRLPGGDVASVAVDVLADLSPPKPPGLSNGAPYVPLVTAVSVELPLGVARLSLRSLSPPSGSPDASSAAGWPGDVALHLQLHPSDARAGGRRLDLVVAYTAAGDRVSAGAAWVF